MKLEIHVYHHYDEKINIRDKCDLAIDGGKGGISYHDWNVKFADNHECGYCGEKLVRGKLINR